MSQASFEVNLPVLLGFCLFEQVSKKWFKYQTYKIIIRNPPGPPSETANLVERKLQTN